MFAAPHERIFLLATILCYCLSPSLSLQDDSPTSDGWITINKYSYAARGYEFYALAKKGLLADDLQDRDVTHAKTMDSCLQEAGESDVKLTVWNHCEKKCSFKTTRAGVSYAFYTGQGSALGQYDVYGYDLITTRDRKTVRTLSEDGQCHMILQLINWPSAGVRSFKCKKYKQNNCLNMFFLKEVAPKFGNLF